MKKVLYVLELKENLIISVGVTMDLKFTHVFRYHWKFRDISAVLS